MARYSIEHCTRFRYAGPVHESVMELRMRPHDGGRQACAHFEIAVTPHTICRDYLDPYGNQVHYFTLLRPHDALDILAKATVEVAPAPHELPVETTWAEYSAMRHDHVLFCWLAASHFARPSPELDAFAAEALPDSSLSPLHWLVGLRDRLQELIRYEKNTTRADSPIEECIAQRAGVCQDFAHVFITLVRCQGIPCRYVSGYLFHREDDASQSGEDAMHAWAEAFVPGMGWMGFDAANPTAPAERYIRVAVGRDYHDVPPTRGVYRGSETEHHEAQVSVTRVDQPKASGDKEIFVNGFQCQVQQNADAVVAQLVGSLGAANVETLERNLQPALGQKPNRVVLDFSGLVMLGSAGVGALLRLRREIEDGGGQLVLAALPESVRQVLVYSGLNRLFTMATDTQSAFKTPDVSSGAES